MQPKLLGLFLVDVAPGMTPQLPDLNGNTNPNPWKTSVPEDSYAGPLLRLLYTSATDTTFYVLVVVAARSSRIAHDVGPVPVSSSADEAA